jgi:hypothetical protein
VDDAEGPGIGIVDLPLRLRQRVFNELIAHADIGQ